MSVEDYEFIAENGWNAYVGKIYPRLGYSVPPEEFMPRLMQTVAQGVKDTKVWEAKGVPVYLTPGLQSGFDLVAQSRSVKAAMLDIYRRPEAVLAAVRAIESEQVPQAIAGFRVLQEATEHGAIGMFVGDTRPTFLAPKYFEKFFWPFLKSAVEQLVEAGITPNLHFDSNWTPFLALPRVASGQGGPRSR